MADLGNLWFSLGLDDSKLEKQWKDALAKYEKKANVNVRLAISKMDFKQFQEAEKKLNKFKNNFSGNIKGKIDLEITQRTLDSLKALQSMGGSVDQWKAIQQAAKAAGQLAKDQANVTNTLLKGQKAVTKEYQSQSLWLENLKNIASNYFSLYAVKNFVTELATVSGEFEKQRITLQAMVGEMEGLEIYGKMKELAVVSPFEFKDLSAYAKQLAAFSVPYEELYDTTKRLADVSAGLGVDMSRIILAYGQIRSAGVLRGCLGRDTLIKTTNGVKAVQDITIGDVLLNDQDELVNVLELIRGKEQMYLIKQSVGDNYRVNENHILTLWDNCTNELVDIYVKDYLKEPERYLGCKITAQKEWSTYSISIEKDIEDDYYGFVLDGNKRFQLADGTITHNTELRQLTEAGVPILEKLAKKFKDLEGQAVSVGDVFSKISQKMVPFEMVKDIFTEMTSAGGKFYRMQEIQADTLAGKISNLKDAYAIMLSEIGSTYDDSLKKGVDTIYKLIENWETLGGVVTTVFVTFASFQAVKITSWLNQQYKGVKNLALAYLDLVQKGKGAASIFTAIPKSIGWGGLLITLAGIATALGSMWENAQRVNKEIEKIATTGFVDLRNELKALDKLIESIKETTEGTRQRKELIDQLNSQYGSYIGNILDEYSALQKVEQAHRNITTALKERAQEESLIKTSKVIEEKYAEGLTDALGTIITKLENKGFETDFAASIAAKIRDEMEKNVNISPEDLFASLDKKWAGIGGKVRDILAYADNNIRGVINYRGVEILKGIINTYNREMERMKQINRAVFEDSSINWEFIKEKTKSITDAYNNIVSNITGTDEEAEEQLRKAKIGYLNQLIALYPKASTTAAQYRKELEKLMVTDKKWRGDIEDILSEFKIPLAFAPKEDESFLQYIERIRDEYKNLKESLKDLTVDPEGIKPGIEAKIKAFEAVAKEFKFSLDEKADNKAQQELLKKQREEVEKLKDEYNGYLTVYKAFLKLKEKTGSTDIAVKGVSAEFKDYAGWLSGYTSRLGGVEQIFKDVFARIAKDAKDKGGDTGKQFVDSMTTALSSLNFKDILNAVDLASEIQDALSKWQLEDFLLTGSGVTLDLSKVLKTQVEADNKVYARRKELLEKITKAAMGDEAEIAAVKAMYGEDWASKAEAEINRLADLEIANNKKIADDKIKELGKAYAKEALGKEFSPDFFSNLGEKTMSQLEAASKKLREMMASPSFLMDTDYLDKVASGEISDDAVKEHIKLWKEFFDLLRSDTDIEHFERAKKKITESGKALSKVISSMKELSQTDSVFSGVLDGVQVAVDAGISIADSFEKVKQTNEETGEVTEVLNVNWANLAITALQVASSVVKAAMAAKQYREEMKMASEKFSRGIIVNARELEIAGEKFNTIFGENLIGALDADNDALRRLNSELKNSSRKVADMKVMTRKGFWGIGRQYTSLSDLAPQLFKADGSVNYEYLDEFLDAYGDKMSESQKSLLEHLKTTYEQYQDAMEDTSEYLSNIFSDTASTIADRMMEAFAATGDAATGLGDLVHGIAKQMAKDLIQSLLVEQYLTPAIDRIKALYDPNKAEFEADSVVRTQKAILVMQDAIQAVGESVPEVNKLLEAIQAMGIDLNADAENASEVLSGLTEDQQNLLMSYINGIRADVSFNKGMFLSVVNSVGEINNNIATAIVVWKQIEANTHRSADGVDRIIGFFESVMGPYDGGGGQAFRVNIA